MSSAPRAAATGRLVHCTYGTDTLDDTLSRVAAIKADNGGDPGTTLAAYRYTGDGRIVVEDYGQPDIRLGYWRQPKPASA